MADRPGVSMTVTAAELGAVGRKLKAVVIAVAKPAALMKRIGAALESSAKRRFRSSQSPDGTPWKPSLRALFSGGKTLVDKARLRDSITSDGDDHQAAIGSNLIYARIQQLGGVIKAKDGGALVFDIPGVGWRRVAQVTLPARPYLGVSDDDRLEIADQVRLHIERSAA